MNHLDHLIGQPLAVRLLSQAIASETLAPAYLFCGSDGTGKRTAVRLFLSELGYDGSFANPDLLWIEPTYWQDGSLIKKSELDPDLAPKSSPQLRLEQIRELVEFLSHPPLSSPYMVVVIEEAETMTNSAASALLKTLEEPGQKRLVILLASEASALLPTLVSRTQIIPFRLLSSDNLRQVLQLAGYQNLDSDWLLLAQGSPGKAIAAERQLATIPPSLLHDCQNFTTWRSALTLAREISLGLSYSTQLWLTQYLQYQFWQRQSLFRVQSLEEVRTQLTQFVSPRLAWEVALLSWLEAGGA